MAATPGDREAFAGRLRVQIAARYPGAVVDVDAARFALRVTGPGLDTTLPLAPLYHACEREPARAPTLITQYAASVERQMTPRAGTDVSPGRLIWCVRTTGYLAGVSRSGDLLTADVAADLVGFVAEDLPGSIMRGVPRQEWESAGLGEASVREAATANTNARFAKLAQRVAALERLPADGWRVAGDTMFQSSALLAPAVLEALVQRSGGDVLLAAPDRSLVLAIPVSAGGAERFHRRVLREWRESMNPCSHHVLRTDGSRLAQVSRRARSAATVLPWLGE